MSSKAENKFGKNKIAKLLISGLLIIVLLKCTQSEEVIVDEWSYYSFDSTMIIAMLSDPEIDFNKIFIKESDPSPISPTYEETTSTWMPDDYFLTAQAVHEMEWMDSLDKWTLYGQKQYYNCAHIPDGPIAMVLTYFKNENRSRYVTYIDIDKDVNIIRTRHVEYSPQVTNWDPLETQIVIPAKKALDLIEQNGGKELRESRGNYCYIIIRYLGKGGFRSTPQWAVSYKNDNRFIARYYLNANTGKIVEVEKMD